MDHQVKQFLDLLHRGAPYAYLWTPEGEEAQDEQGNAYWKPSTIWYRVGDIPDVAKLWPNRNVFFGVHPTKSRGGRYQKGKIETIGAINCLFADYDLEDGQEPLDALADIMARVPFRPTAVVFSGGGWHLYWLLEQPLQINGNSDREQAKLLQYAWQELVGSDSQVKDLARVLRLPGSCNHKPEFAPDFPAVRLHQFAPAIRYTLAEVTAAAEHKMAEIAAREQQRNNTPPPQPVGLDDQELIQIIRNSKNGPEFERLWAGDLSAYANDHSRADMAMCNILAYWTGKDQAQMDRIMRASGLYRDKWDRGDYAKRTIEEACRSANKVWERGRRSDADDEAVRQAQQMAEDGALWDASGPQGGGNGGGNGNNHRNGGGGGNGGGGRPDYAILGADFIAQHSGHIYARSSWWQYQGGVWKTVHELEMRRLAWDYMATSGFPANVNAVENLLQYAASHVFKRDDELDADANLINLLNGTYNMELRALLTHNPDHLLTTQLPFAYDPDAQAPLWDRYLQTTFLDKQGKTDPDLIAMIQEAVGYSLTTDNSKHVMFWLYGKGANGKGVLFHILSKLGGTAAIPFNAGLLRKEQYQLATLAGKRIALCPEADTNTVVEDGTIKALVAGDEMQVRMIHQQPFTLHPKVKLWWAMNSLPDVKDNSEGFWRRLRVVPFRADFEKRDRAKRMDDLKERLEAELPGIFNWAMEGLHRLRDTGQFTEVKQVADETAEYRRLSNSVQSFFDERCDLASGRNVGAQALYAAYHQWAKDNGDRHPINSRKFRTEAENLSVNYVKRSVGIVAFGVGLTGVANAV